MGNQQTQISRTPILTMKTIRQWLNELPDPERTRAFNNVIPEILEARYPSMYMALHHAFVWDDSDERHKYWSGVVSRYEPSGNSG